MLIALWILPIVMRLVLLIDSLGYAENSDINVAIVSQTSRLPFWFMLKTYFCELLYHVRFSTKLSQIIFRLCWQKVMDFVSIDKTVFVQRHYKF